MPYSSRTEHLIVDALRAEGALALSLVAVIENLIVGHVAFSLVEISEASGTWYLLGPVSVLPAEQRRGIGSAVIRTGLARLRASGAAGCVLAGDPRYYTRFGFAHDPSITLEGVPPEAWLALRFLPSGDRGSVRLHPAFSIAAR
jgi:putative acetyltransferase